MGTRESERACSRVEIIVSKYDRWEAANGDPILDRLDILGIDPDGRLVVVELKCDIAPHAVHIQAINYAAMVSRLSPKGVAELYALRITTTNSEIDVESALPILTSDRILTQESIRQPRIVLVASDFPLAVTAAIMWLNEQGVDISVVRFRAYRLRDEQVIISFRQLFPIPSVENFTVRRKDHRLIISTDPGEPWDESSLQKLAKPANLATTAMLDSCSS